MNPEMMPDNRPKGEEPQVHQREMSEDEVAEAFPDEDAEADGPGIGDRIAAAVNEVLEDAPEWVELPANLKIPMGKKPMHFRFRADWTDTPQKGDRVVTCWTLSEMEERQAYTRGRGDATRSIAELTKQMIRAIDGFAVDWTKPGGPGHPNTLWADLGTKCRQMLQNVYLKTHTLSQEEQLDFFANCVAVTSSTVR